MSKSKIKVWGKKYIETYVLGEGGNANVYHVISKETGKEYALKSLKSNMKSPEKCGRFIDEINILNENSSIVEGIIPISDYSIEEYWYTMPIAEPIMLFIKEKEATIKEIILGVIQLCETLEILHKKSVTHRDIKPSNIYYHDKRFCLGDFGLVNFPENENNFTRSDKGLGAVFTIAPEMKRNPKEADGKKLIFSH